LVVVVILVVFANLLMVSAQCASFNVVALCILSWLWFDLEFMSCYGGGCADLE
jgi:hypothetical protein